MSRKVSTPALAKFSSNGTAAVKGYISPAFSYKQVLCYNSKYTFGSQLPPLVLQLTVFIPLDIFFSCYPKTLANQLFWLCKIPLAYKLSRILMFLTIIICTLQKSIQHVPLRSWALLLFNCCLFVICVICSTSYFMSVSWLETGATLHVLLSSRWEWPFRSSLPAPLTHKFTWSPVWRSLGPAQGCPGVREAERWWRQLR